MSATGIEPVTNGCSIEVSMSSYSLYFIRSQTNKWFHCPPNPKSSLFPPDLHQNYRKTNFKHEVFNQQREVSMLTICYPMS